MGVARAIAKAELPRMQPLGVLAHTRRVAVCCPIPGAGLWGQAASSTSTPEPRERGPRRAARRLRLSAALCSWVPAGGGNGVGQGSASYEGLWPLP